MYLEQMLCRSTQGCQLLDFSLRSQTFCYTADFFTTFLYMLKTETFLHIPSQKILASTLELKNFDSILPKNSAPLDKNGKSAPTQLAPTVSGHTYGLR